MRGPTHRDPPHAAPPWQAGARSAPRPPRRRAAGRWPQDGRAFAEPDHGDRPLVHPVDTDQLGDRRSGNRVRSAAGMPAPSAAASNCDKHRARIPVDVAKAALSVPPSGSPWHAGHDDRRTRTVRRWADRDERVIRGDTTGRRRAGRRRRNGDVQLQREAAAGRPGRAKEPCRVRPLVVRTMPADRCNSRPERGQIQRRRRHSRSAGKYGDRGCRRRGNSRGNAVTGKSSWYRL